MRTMMGALPIAAALALATAPAFAVSDGNYTPAKQHCAGSDDNFESDHTADPSCHNFILTVSDANGHEYFGFGTYQTPDNLPPAYLSFTELSLNVHAASVWYDNGTDGCQMFTIDTGLAGMGDPQIQQANIGVTPDPASISDPSKYKINGPVACDFTNPPAESTPSALHLYVGADDNLDAGEHDSSNTVNNGPSDGGAVQLNLDPKSLNDWIDRANNHDLPGLLTHPLPLADAGGGACADGFCVSVQTTRREEAYDPGTSGATANHGSVANYEGHQWDPETCDGPDDSAADCSDATHPGYTPATWDQVNGDPGVDPGFQFFEDPDAQDSPLTLGVIPFPKPAIYVGTCGVIIGGGPEGGMFRLPPSPPAQPGAPYVNSAGQLVVPTDCHGEHDAP